MFSSKSNVDVDDDIDIDDDDDASRYLLDKWTRPIFVYLKHGERVAPPLNSLIFRLKGTCRNVCFDVDVDVDVDSNIDNVCLLLFPESRIPNMAVALSIRCLLMMFTVGLNFDPLTTLTLLHDVIQIIIWTESMSVMNGEIMLSIDRLTD